jgi:hypothetical protein
MDVWNGARGLPHRRAVHREAIVSLIALMVVLTAFMSGCGVGVASGNTTSSATKARLSEHSADPQSPAAAAAVMSAPGRVESMGRSRYNDIYGGLRVHDRGAASSLDIYLVEPSSSAEADLTSAAQPLPVVFHKAALSEKSLYALETRLDDALPLLRNEGVLIAASAPLTQTGRLDVEVVHLEAGDREKIATAIHSDLFDVSDVPEVYSDVRMPQATDTRPFMRR